MAVRGRRATDDGRRAARDEVLVRVGDLAGRPRGTGFVADHHGTVVTSHEAVDGLARIVLHATADRVCVVTSDAVTPLPALDLALIRTEGLCVDPLPFALREGIETGAYVRIAAGGWREARVLGTADVTYTATDGFHLLRDALELAIGTAGSEALRLGGGAAGGPVLDMTTGAVVGVLGTALEAQHRTTGFAVPLRGWRAEQPLAELLARNAATVPAYGTDLNLAGVLELTATTVGSDGPGASTGAVAAAGTDPVERVGVVRSSPPSPKARPPCSASSAHPAAAVRRNWPPWPPGAAKAPSPRPRCGCAAPTCWPTTRPWRTRRAARWSGRAGSWRLRELPARARSVRSRRRFPGGTTGSWGTSGRSGSPGWRARRGGRCCCFSTGPRNCRPRSRTGWPNGPPGRWSGCGRTGRGS